MLYMPISFLFYKENGLGSNEYLTLHAVYSGVIAFFEVPSGYVADVWGRKKAMVLGTFLGTLGFGVYSVSSGVTGFLIAEILLGIGASLLSGADTALLYDSLLNDKKEDKYVNYEGKITAVGNFAEAFAGVFVTVIVFSTYRSYFVIQTFLAGLAFAAALFLSEPTIHRGKKKAGFRDILSVVNTTFRRNKHLRNIVSFSAGIGFASLSMAWMTQPVLFQIGLEERYFGIVWVVLNLLVALGSMAAAKADKILGMKGALVYMALPLSLGFIFVGLELSYLAFIPLAILYFVRGTAHPVLKKYINQLTDSSQRATVLSLRSLLIRMLFFGFGPVLGYMSDKFSLEYALYLCGISVLIISVVFFVMIIFARKR